MVNDWRVIIIKGTGKDGKIIMNGMENSSQGLGVGWSENRNKEM